jgi:hypothetical protein
MTIDTYTHTIHTHTHIHTTHNTHTHTQHTHTHILPSNSCPHVVFTTMSGLYKETGAIGRNKVKWLSKVAALEARVWVLDSAT